MQEQAEPAGNVNPLGDLAALTFAILFPVFMAWVYFVVVVGETQRANPFFVAAYAGAKLVQALFPLLYVGLCERGQLRPARPTTRGLGPAVAFAALVGLGLFALSFAWLRHRPVLADTPGRI